ncbi:hypothetical protein LSH36_167g07057 [Paralvinella palmiformis]|uniref:Kinesin-like protein KIF16B n=1 Tax=Paralvinella palmiformis TaxID=53620 RepID=A0AAD9JSF5_9ANNE|nr:hypothetical protein LSH36_167g07057 [Paralvinella palmiformis]
MASVKVAVRVRPLNQRELDMESKFIIQMENKRTSIINIRIPESAAGDVCRDRVKDFTFDYSYWSVNKNSSNFASQEQVFKDLGLDVIGAAYEGYNACVFAYGQTGSGKTYTMMGSPDDVGLIPRICQELFTRMTDEEMTYRTEVSYLEIYNEKVRDLLKQDNKSQHSLRIREHPKDGPYVQDLSKHLVMNFSDINELMQKGNENRTTASTLMNNVSSRSHAIFTIVFTQAKFSKECPLEMQSKVHLVDLAGSERADSTGATGQRLKEGGSINKSLVTLGNVISALAISPADCNYGETMSSLRYANRAKNIINKPYVNEDPNVKLIRELRAEIAHLRDLLSTNVDKPTSPSVQEKLTENEARVKMLTEEWASKWVETTKILEEEKTLALRKEGQGVILDSMLPHLIGIDDDILSTGIMLYHLREGSTVIGMEVEHFQPDIALQGVELLPHHCTIEHTDGKVSLIPSPGAYCTINGFAVTEPTPLTQGAVILLGKASMFRFNHPGQVAQLKKEFKGSNPNLSRVSLLSRSLTDLYRSSENLNNSGLEHERNHFEQVRELVLKRQEIEEMEIRFKQAELSRLTEQQEHEDELEKKRSQLDDLRAEAEAMKHQAEKVGQRIEMEVCLAKKRAEREAAKYKRRSMDVERQLHEFIEQQCSGERALNTGIHSAIISDKERILKELEREIEWKKENLQQERKNELKLLQEEHDHLESMKHDYTNFLKYASDLDESVRERLQMENENLVAAHKALTERERLMYDQYKLEEKQIRDDNKKYMKQVEDEIWHLEADKIYVRELDANLQQMASEARTDAEKEEIEREKEALEEEKVKIAEKEHELEQQKLEIEQETAKRLSDLQVKRSHQVESLNISRREVRNLEEQWCHLVNREIQSKDRTIEEVMMRIEDGEEELEGLQDRYRSIAAQIHPRNQQMNQSAEAGPTAGTASGDRLQVNDGEECQSQAVKTQPENTNVSSLGLNSESKKEVHFAENPLDASISVLLGTDITESQYNTLLAEERNSLLNKMKELGAMEELLRHNEVDLNKKRQESDQQKQDDNEIIERERCNLQELEDQERINALVEQEVRRRLLEEKLQRERTLVNKQECDRMEQEQEITRIRKAHQRELQRLKAKYEGNLPSDNLPTRANPYAAFTERAASIASIHSTISAMSPITGNPFSVSIPTYLHRGSGLDVYYEYEVKLSVIDEKWTVFRRYRRFRELHMELKLSYPEIAGLVFPPKKFFGSRSERTVAERRLQLETYLAHVIEILWRKPESPLHPSKVKHYTKKVLCDFNPFFKKGVFETGKYSTG